MKPPQAHQVTCQNCGRENRLPAAAASLPRCGHCHRPVPWIVDAADDNFTEIAEHAAIPVLVDIWAPWCVHRRRLRPALEKLACDLADQVKVVNVNVDETPRLQARFGVEAVPTLVLLRGSRIVAYQAGAPPEPSLRAWLAQALGKSETMQAGEPCQPANSGLSGLAEHVMWPELLRSTVGTSAGASESRARGNRGRAMQSDSEIREDVIHELQWDPQVPDSEAIGVAVKDGAVTLTGNG